MSNSGARRFSRLIEPHLDALFRAAFRLVRDEADAQDLVQDTCVRAWGRIAELDESRHTKAWLLRVLYNLFVDGVRRARQSPVVVLENATDRVSRSPCTDLNPEEMAYTAQRAEALQRAWLQLDRGQRALLALRAEGYRPSEIAEITGLATDALYARLYRARQRFGRQLTDLRANEQRDRMELAK